MSIVIRVMSAAGRSRLELPPTTTMAQLREQIADRLGLDSASLKMFSDTTMKKALVGRDSDPVGKCLKNGDMVHVNNEGATIAHLKQQPKFKTHEEIKQEKEEKAKNAPVVDSGGHLIKNVEKKEETESKDFYGKTLKPVVKEVRREVKMISEKKLGDNTGDQFVKH